MLLKRACSLTPFIQKKSYVIIHILFLFYFFIAHSHNFKHILKTNKKKHYIIPFYRALSKYYIKNIYSAFNLKGIWFIIIIYIKKICVCAALNLLHLFPWRRTFLHRPRANTRLAAAVRTDRVCSDCRLCSWNKN